MDQNVSKLFIHTYSNVLYEIFIYLFLSLWLIFNNGSALLREYTNVTNNKRLEHSISFFVNVYSIFWVSPWWRG